MKLVFLENIYIDWKLFVINFSAKKDRMLSVTAILVDKYSYYVNIEKNQKVPIPSAYSMCKVE